MRIKLIFVLVAALGAIPAGAVDKTTLLPDTIGAPAQVAALAAPEQFASRSLYEYVDGGADVYMDAGLISCTVRRYGGLKNKSAEFEIALFTMAAPVNAFGLFRQLHEGHTRAMGTESVAEPLRVSFWKSSLYAEVIDKSSKPVPDSALLSLAKTVANRLPGDTLLPAELRLLPGAEKVSGSEQYRKSGFLSRSFLDNVHALCHDLRVGQRRKREARHHRQGIRRGQSARARVRVPQPGRRVRRMRAEGIRG